MCFLTPWAYNVLLNKGLRLMIEPNVAEVDIEAMSTDELRKLTLHLRDSLKTREVQLERKFEEVANMQEVTHRLMVRHTDCFEEVWITSFSSEASARP